MYSVGYSMAVKGVSPEAEVTTMPAFRETYGIEMQNRPRVLVHLLVGHAGPEWLTGRIGKIPWWVGLIFGP